VTGFVDRRYSLETTCAIVRTLVLDRLAVAAKTPTTYCHL